MKTFSGIVPVLITPLDTNGNVCKSSLVNLLKIFSNKNCSGLWVLGTGGEDMCLTFRQRVEVAEIIDEFKSNMKIVVGMSFFSPKESIEFMKITKNFNFDAYHAMPYHPKVSQNQLIEWYKMLADNSEKKLWAYTSGNWAQRMDAKFISKIKDINNFEGVKYSTSNIVDLQEVSLLQDENFQVISAVIKTFFSALSLGLNASTSIEGMLFYDHIRSIYECFKNNDLKGALKLQNFLNTELLTYPSLAAKDNFLRSSEIKYILFKNNIIYSDDVSLYYRKLNDSEKNEIDIFRNKYISKILS